MRRSEASLLARLGRGGRGDNAVARTAWQRLAGAGDRGDEIAITAAWEAWLSDTTRELPAELARWPLPREVRGKVLRCVKFQAGALRPVVAGDPILLAATWTMAAYQKDPAVLRELAGWPLPGSDATTLLNAAVEPGNSAEIRAILGEIIPGEEARRRDRPWQARYFLMTGQTERYRELDPDGTLLAAAYRDPDARIRGALREAVVATGEPGLVRGLSAVGERDPQARVTANERDQVAAALAGREDWAGTWRLATALPLADAMPLARSLAGRWSPGDPREQQFSPCWREPTRPRSPPPGTRSRTRPRCGWTPGRCHGHALSPRTDSGPSSPSCRRAGG